MTVIREDGDEDIFWDSAFFRKVLWKPDGVYVVKIVNRGIKNFVIVESFWQEEVRVIHEDLFFRLHCT